MPNFRVTLVNYRDCTVEAPDLATARQWAENRQGNELFNDSMQWSLDSIVPDEDEEPIAVVSADGQHRWPDLEVDDDDAEA